jgi:hypothetical protein
MGKTGGRAAQPASVSLDPSGSSYVAGTAHDPSNDGTNAFVRKYSRSGGCCGVSFLVTASGS